VKHEHFHHSAIYCAYCNSSTTVRQWWYYYNPQWFPKFMAFRKIVSVIKYTLCPEKKVPLIFLL